MANRKTYEVVGYTYEAALHCVPCTTKRFPRVYDEARNWAAHDREGNEVRPITLDDVVDSDCCDDCFILLAD